MTHSFSAYHEFGTNVVTHGGFMSGRQNIEDQIRDLAALNRHHVERMRWLLVQMSDEEMKRLGLDEPNRNADDWLDRVLHKMDSKLDRFMNAHLRLQGKHTRKTRRILGFLDRLKENLASVQAADDAAKAAANKINSGMRK